MTVDCPLCPPEDPGELIYRWTQDSAGDAGGFYGIFSFWQLELVEKTCDCDIPAEVFDKIEAELAKEPPSYDDLEP